MTIKVGDRVSFKARLNIADRSMLMLAYSKNSLNDERYSFDIVAEVFSINVTNNIIVVKIPHGKYKTCCSNCLELCHLSSEFLWSLDGNLLGHLGKY